jgi:hypothetical protein
MEGADLAESGCVMMRKERFTPVLKAALGVKLSPEAAEEEQAGMAQNSARARDWASGWLRAHGMNLKRSGASEQEQWNYCTRGTVNRWLDGFSRLPAGLNSDVLWHMDEVMVAPSGVDLR